MIRSSTGALIRRKPAARNPHNGTRADRELTSELTRDLGARMKRGVFDRILREFR